MSALKLCGATVPHSGHICAFFDSREQKYDVLIPFFRDAIAAGDEIINIVDERDHADHVKSLTAGRVPVQRATATKQLNILTSEETYLQEGEAVLPRLLEFLGSTLAKAKREHRCLRTCGEMNWVERGKVPIRDVLEYETKVNYFLPDNECTLLCVYDLAHTPSALVSDILATHPFAILKGRLRANPYFVQPDEYLEMLNGRA